MLGYRDTANIFNAPRVRC